MCGGPLKKTTKVRYSTEIWFDGSTFDPKGVRKDCKCSFTNLNAHNLTTLRRSRIEVRIEIPYRDKNASSTMCSSALLTHEHFFRNFCKESTEHMKVDFSTYDSNLFT
ncbi:hypothetical protein DPMN_044766 [Dreissena polymorpha]|uniref:Uncharacterized protein n=1 Tax=Dreissena polymorpha TaxID=45954 RepID=A0A9D4D6F2_DREPO|nr:hypothetical protein DPMN_044766 [Dreissena polymorpha]